MTRIALKIQTWHALRCHRKSYFWSSLLPATRVHLPAARQDQHCISLSNSH
uniref:Uncharacterized protein n=1 Tax=Arundo donax TaxID=35708 RepID=A0A0A9E3I8_ARUDO